MARSRSARKRTFALAARHIIGLTLAFLFIAPLAWSFIVSLKP